MTAFVSLALEIHPMSTQNFSQRPSPGGFISHAKEVLHAQAYCLVPCSYPPLPSSSSRHLVGHMALTSCLAPDCCGRLGAAAGWNFAYALAIVQSVEIVACSMLGK